MLSDDDMTRLARNLASRKSKEYYSAAPKPVSQLYTKSAYIAIYQLVTMALIQAGMTDSEIYQVNGLGDEVVSAMLRSGFHIPVNFDSAF